MASNSPVSASSATYRKVVNRVAKELHEPPHHSRYPSDDFDRGASLIDAKAKTRALQWYKRGMRRGFIEACDALLDGQLELKGKTLLCPPEVVISIRVKLKGSPWKKHSVKFSAEDLEFK